VRLKVRISVTVQRKWQPSNPFGITQPSQKEEMVSEIRQLTEFAIETVHQAGTRALDFYGKGKRQLKFDMSLVTETELHLAQIFREQLKKQYPEHQIFQNNLETTGYTHDDKRYLWIYDPLDGVANFQAGIPIWGICLALLENFWPILGIFHMPATGDLFHACAGQKAYRGDMEIRVSDQEALNDESLFLTFSRFHQRYRTTFPGKVRNLGCTGAHLSYVAMGRAEAALLSNVTYQDLAAARVLIESAGGKIFKMDGTEFFLNEYLEGQQIDEDLLVGSPNAISQVREFLKEQI
jgi:myo-inositol-1(or 4)-monophosphatase